MKKPTLTTAEFEQIKEKLQSEIDTTERVLAKKKVDEATLQLTAKLTGSEPDGLAEVEREVAALRLMASTQHLKITEAVLATECFPGGLRLAVNHTERAEAELGKIRHLHTQTEVITL